MGAARRGAVTISKRPQRKEIEGSARELAVDLCATVAEECGGNAAAERCHEEGHDHWEANDGRGERCCTLSVVLLNAGG